MRLDDQQAPPWKMVNPLDGRKPAEPRVLSGPSLAAGGADHMASAVGAAADTCTACEAGKYREGAGATSEAQCAKCGPGKYGPTIGASSESACSLCAGGKWSA